MRNVWAALVALFVLGSAAFAQTLSPQAFTAEFAKALRAAAPSATVTAGRDLQLTFHRADGSSATVSIANAYRDSAGNPARLDELAKVFATTLMRPQVGTPAKLDRTRIVPVIKDRDWLAALQKNFGARDGKQEPVFDDFNKELVVVYAEDDKDRTRYLTSGEDFGDRKGLRALAIENLKRILPKIEQRQHDDVISIISAGGNYEPSLLLFDDIWSGGQIKFDGDIIVAIPARDALLVTGSKNRKGLRVMRDTVADLAKGPYRLTDTLFVYRNGKFVKFGRN